ADRLEDLWCGEDARRQADDACLTAEAARHRATTVGLFAPNNHESDEVFPVVAPAILGITADLSRASGEFAAVREMDSRDLAHSRPAPFLLRVEPGPSA